MPLIRIRSQDTDDEAWERHAAIEKRLTELGPDSVRSLMGHGLPTEWNTVISAWLAGDRLGPKPNGNA